VKFVTLMPTHDNDGKAIPKQTINGLLRRLEIKFHGITVEGPVRGVWIDSETGERYADENLKVVVVCERRRYLEARQEVIRIGRRLRQKAMYFEVQYMDGVEVIPID
jgi:hypothetical protein